MFPDKKAEALQASDPAAARAAAVARSVFNEINPNGTVPAVQDGTLRLAEASNILMHIAQSRELEQWYPSDFETRQKVGSCCQACGLELVG